MDNWNPSVVFEIGYGMHEERIARAAAANRLAASMPTGPDPRAKLAWLLLAVARWLAPGTADTRTPRGSLPSAARS